MWRRHSEALDNRRRIVSRLLRHREPSSLYRRLSSCCMHHIRWGRSLRPKPAKTCRVRADNSADETACDHIAHEMVVHSKQAHSYGD